MGAMSQPSMRPVSTVMRSASWFITGNAPGKPRQTGQVCVFGSAPNSTGEAQNIFERVLSWTCTSRPMVARYFMRFRIFVEVLKRCCLCHVERSETSLAVGLRQLELQKGSEILRFTQNYRGRFQRFNASTLQRFNALAVDEFCSSA